MSTPCSSYCSSCPLCISFPVPVAIMCGLESHCGEWGKERLSRRSMNNTANVPCGGEFSISAWNQHAWLLSSHIPGWGVTQPPKSQSLASEHESGKKWQHIYSIANSPCKENSQCWLSQDLDALCVNCGAYLCEDIYNPSFLMADCSFLSPA